MKVLVLSVTAGEGHNSTAKALKKQLEATGHECEMLDIYLNASKGLYELISKGYLLAVDNLKRLYAKVYTALENRKKNPNDKGFSRYVNTLISGKTYQKICEYKPDVIIYTHVFAGMLVDVLKQRGELSIPCIGIVTDFVMHPFWEEVTRTEKIVIPNEMLIPFAMRKGFTQEQILPLGIPIDEKFSRIQDCAELRMKLGLDIFRKTVLIMGGSMGYGNIADTIRDLDKSEIDMQIICVCGNNIKAREEIDAMTTQKKLLNLGYVNNVDELMDAADCIVTKPGGITTSETLAKRLPMIICNPIPGQEERNAEFLQNNGAAIAVGGAFSLSDAVSMMFTNPKKAEAMRDCIELIRKPYSTANICRAAEELLQTQKEKING